MIFFMKVNFASDNCNIVNSGAYNMEYDLKTLEFAIKNKVDYAIVRFYQWYPKCVSLGRNQKLEEAFEGIDCVRRPSGGRALLHDRELTYSFVSRCFKPSIIESYKDISDGLILGFKKLEIELDYGTFEHKNLEYCMNTTSGADICYKGKKFIGSAQFRSEGYLLQHGSIPYTLDYELIEKLFNQPVEKDKIITLNEIKKDISTRELIEALKEGFKEKFEE